MKKYGTCGVDGDTRVYGLRPFARPSRIPLALHQLKVLGKACNGAGSEPARCLQRFSESSTSLPAGGSPICYRPGRGCVTVGRGVVSAVYPQKDTAGNSVRQDALRINAGRQGPPPLTVAPNATLPLAPRPADSWGKREP